MSVQGWLFLHAMVRTHSVLPASHFSCKAPFLYSMLNHMPCSSPFLGMTWKKETTRMGHLWVTVLTAGWRAQMGFVSQQSKHLKWKMETKQNKIILRPGRVAFLLSFCVLFDVDISSLEMQVNSYLRSLLWGSSSFPKTGECGLALRNHLALVPVSVSSSTNFCNWKGATERFIFPVT